MRRFVALDRDGTLIVERHYLADPAGVQLVAGAGASLRHLSGLGCGLVVVTNQSGIGRGFFSPRQVELVHRRLRGLLEAEGVQLDGIYVCPHAPADGCACRKPGVALMERAASELGFDPREAFVVGDKECDIEMGKRVGATTLLVRTGYGEQVERGARVAPDFVVDGLVEAAGVIGTRVGRDGGRSAHGGEDERAKLGSGAPDGERGGQAAGCRAVHGAAAGGG
jgi:histidinol-phosphate phosphatase family protein